VKFIVTYWPGTASMPADQVKDFVNSGRAQVATRIIEATSWEEAQAQTFGLSATSDGCLITPRRSDYLFEPTDTEKNSLYVCAGHLAFARRALGPGDATSEDSQVCDVCQNEPDQPVEPRPDPTLEHRIIRLRSQLRERPDGTPNLRDFYGRQANENGDDFDQFDAALKAYHAETSAMYEQLELLVARRNRGR
jgi:hypothetical protein